MKQTFKKPSYYLLSQAMDGDEKAIEKILAFYDPYISKCCLRPLYDEYGNVYIALGVSAAGGAAQIHEGEDFARAPLQFYRAGKTGLYTLWENLTVGYDDLLTTPVVSELTGYSAQSIQRWCNQKILVGFKIRGTLTIPRLAVVEFMSGDRATAIVRKSSKHLDLLRTYAQDCHEGAMTITY